MKHSVHFGAGNIGRGFIGEILFKNGFHIDFVDVNNQIIHALNEKGKYEIEIAQKGQSRIEVTNVAGINSKEHPEQVIEAIQKTDIITTAIGSNILPFIAELLAKGIEARRVAGNTQALDVMACENMIGGSQFLYQEVKKYLSPEGLTFADNYIGFPNAAVDRIVPTQSHEDSLFVMVEPFNEWVVETKRLKNPDLRLEDVHYGAKTILEALQNPNIKSRIESVLAEIRSLLIAKWNFDKKELENYHKVIIERFENPFIVDEVSRVARTPIRKLGYNERFIRPIRELKELSLSYKNLLKTVGYAFDYRDVNDEESIRLGELLAKQSVKDVVIQVTGLDDQELIEQIVEYI